MAARSSLDQRQTFKSVKHYFLYRWWAKDRRSNWFFNELTYDSSISLNTVFQTEIFVITDKQKLNFFDKIKKLNLQRDFQYDKAGKIGSETKFICSGPVRSNNVNFMVTLIMEETRKKHQFL